MELNNKKNMTKKYSSHSPDFKLKVALEAAKNEKTMNQIASASGVSPSQVAEWKKQLIEAGGTLFQNKRQIKAPEAHEDVMLLQQQVGKLTVQLEWLKKKSGNTF